MSLDPVSALCSCASTSRSWAERAATLQLHRCELLTCTRRLALALPERFRIPPRGIWEVAPARRLPHQCGDAWRSGRTLRCLRNPFMLNDLEAWKTFPAPIPFTIRVWTRPHSAGLSEPVADGWQTEARPRPDVAQSVFVRRPILPCATFPLFSSGSDSPPPLSAVVHTRFARAALGFFPLPHTEAVAVDSATQRRILVAELLPFAFGPRQMAGSASAVRLRS